MTDLALKPLHKSLDLSGSINGIVCECVCKIFALISVIGLDQRSKQHESEGDMVGTSYLHRSKNGASGTHLKAILICALDTGMRQGEIFSLRWRDVDLENGLLTIQALHTKTMKERHVALTARVSLELERLKANASDNPNGLVFGILDNVKRSFTSARSDAGLKDVRFHDLRHTAATRLVGAHIPLSEVGRVLGHTQANTTYRYVNANIETAKRAAAALNAFNGETTETVAEPELVQ